MIRIESITKRFRKLKALDNISAEFAPGQVVSLIGPNGSGKTTLIKCILGMVRANEGAILVDDKEITRDHSYRKKIGYMPQIGRYPDNMKVGQLFKMLISLRAADEEKLDRELQERFNLKDIFGQSMRTLSGGTRQKVSSAIAFLFDPPVLILDEPTAGLDPLSSEILKEKITSEKEKGKLILITSHVLSDLDDLTTHIMYLQEGRLQFLKDIESLRAETGERRLGRAIAAVMKGNRSNSLRIETTETIKSKFN